MTHLTSEPFTVHLIYFSFDLSFHVAIFSDSVIVCETAFIWGISSFYVVILFVLILALSCLLCASLSFFNLSLLSKSANNQNNNSDNEASNSSGQSLYAHMDTGIYILS